MKTIGVTGYKGRLGSYLLSHYPNYVGLDCDVRNPEQVRSSIKSSQVDTVLHLAAISDVDFCEKPENAQLVSDVNLKGTFNVCRAAEDVGLEVILLSSDHVFSGKWGKYKEHNKPKPVNYYGLSKFAAEGLQHSFDNLKIVRTSYLFDVGRLPNMQDDDNSYATFIIRSFMYLPHFAKSLDDYFLLIKKPKILHISGNKNISWYKFMSDLAKEIFKYSVKLNRHTRDRKDYVRRPYWAGLNVSLSKKLGLPQFSYIDGIKQMLEDSK